jgi:hypothetical protein
MVPGKASLVSLRNYTVTLCFQDGTPWRASAASGLTYVAPGRASRICLHGFRVTLLPAPVELPQLHCEPSQLYDLTNSGQYLTPANGGAK